MLGDGLASRTRNTITSVEEMRKELRCIRERGYSIDREENEEGIRCVGVPVLNHDDDVIASISVAGPAFRIDEARLEVFATLAMEAAREISARLGMHRPDHDRPSQLAGER